MENDPAKSREALWRRPLTEAKRLGLAAHPELELEACLTEALSRLPEPEVPSNFTSRVMLAVDQSEAQDLRSGLWTLNWRALLPRIAVAAAIMVFLGISFQRYAVHSQRAALVKTIAQLTVVEPLPNVEALENLEAIQRLTQSSHADGELLATLQ